MPKCRINSTINKRMPLIFSFVVIFYVLLLLFVVHYCTHIARIQHCVSTIISIFSVISMVSNSKHCSQPDPFICWPIMNVARMNFVPTHTYSDTNIDMKCKKMKYLCVYWVLICSFFPSDFALRYWHTDANSVNVFH